MAGRVKEFVEVRELGSLDELIARLIEIRDALPEAANAQLRMRGDEVFGRHLCVSYFRDPTVEESACEKRYVEDRDGSQRDVA